VSGGPVYKRTILSLKIISVYIYIYKSIVFTVLEGKSAVVRVQAIKAYGGN
jgi:hypothetical protein